MKLIFVHGRAQQEFEPAQLKTIWVNALTEGLTTAGLALPKDVQIELPYYGKLLFNLSENPPPPPVVQATRSQTGIVVNRAKQLEFYQDWCNDLVKQNKVSQQDVAAIKDLLSNKRGGAEQWETTQKLLRWFDEIPSLRLGNAALRLRTKDVFHYLTQPSIQNQVNQVVESAFDSEPCIVVGHSLGSVVSYIILKNNPIYNIVQFITLGSPLGVSAVKRHLGTLRMPMCVRGGNWFNAYDEGDVIALNPLNETFFNVRPPITNKNDVINTTANKHGIKGYLNDPVIAKTIFDALHR